MQEAEKALLKSLVHVIWADGEVNEDERRLLGGVLNQLDLDDKALTEVASMMSRPPELANLRDSVQDHESRREIMKVLLAMAMADGKVEISELRFLNKIARQLELTDQELETLKNETISEIHADSEES